MRWCQFLCISMTGAACPSNRDPKPSQNRESAVLLPVHILIRVLKSISESLTICRHKPRKHLAVSISSIKILAKSGWEIRPISRLYRQNNGLFFQCREQVGGAQKVWVFSSDTRTQSIVPCRGCDFYQFTFGRWTDRSAGQNVMDMKMASP